ncbi:hypothetical protein HanRHA438_Chr08g0369531 [Helianthus annuus]|nr:hypothetical protein HanRHA438_Chr08g0369531 [Helianthus annuus]
MTSVMGLKIEDLQDLQDLPLERDVDDLLSKRFEKQFKAQIRSC